MTSAGAQSYPAKTIRLIVPYTPGGDTDIVARHITPKLNEPVQLENHIRGALLLGANAREVLEVIVNSTAYVGMPTTVQVIRVLDRVVKEEGRSSELSERSP